MINNLTSSYVNKAVQAYESPQPMSTDVIAGIGQNLMRLCKGKKFFGKAFDLSSAHRQLAIHPDSSWCSYVACADPSGGKPLIFRMSALPFGSAMTVFAFLRVAISVWFLGVHHLLLPWSDFYDDIRLLVRLSRGVGVSHRQGTAWRLQRPTCGKLLGLFTPKKNWS